MLATALLARRRRRGIVLVLILAMLGLLALIGVTFATFSGQAQVGARGIAAALNRPDPENILDFALAQLINDTDGPTSAIHGHSLKRDMYGTDARNNGAMAYLPDGTPMTMKLAGSKTIGTQSYPVVSTNIPAGGSVALAGANFLRWIVRIDPVRFVDSSSGTPVPRYLAAQTFEVLSDDISNGLHVLTLSQQDPSAGAVGLRPLPNNSGVDPISGQAVTFKMDGRFQRAFNGLGLSPISITQGPAAGMNAAALGNFLYANAIVPGGMNADTIGMDEDYDAVDLENWFLALQSADGNVVIPSFHRPGVLTAADWVGMNEVAGRTLNDDRLSRAKLLRPRGIDHTAAGRTTFPDLVPAASGANAGKITYDVDNDGDGVTDSVWVDLGFPVQRDQSTGKLFKPLFAMMVLGLNGRLPINTVGNIQGRDNTAGSIPTINHTSHLGYSVNEINPKYAFNGLGGGDGTLQLQKLLQGFVDSTTGATIDGRWGESELLIAAQRNINVGQDPRLQIYPRPGRAGNRGGSDDDFTALDFLPQGASVYPEDGDFPDATGRTQLPSERFRRFVTPMDTVGTGWPIGWGDAPSGLNRSRAAGALNFGSGFDKWGRQGFFSYFRPAGVPPDRDAMGNILIPNTVSNPYHGYDAARNPIDSAVSGSRQFWSAMPWNNNNGTKVPTFVAAPNGLDVNSGYPGSGGSGYAIYPGYQSGPVSAGSLERDAAHEMNLYAQTPFDEPFGPTDLEWLYRAQDTDGSSLQSRLGALLPEAFDNQSTSLIRRRLFSVDSWTPITYAWTNDNPRNLFGNNANFTQYANASFYSQNNVTPPLMHQDRKLNLNYPLPISTNPFEPVRLKWINDAYNLAKSVLPPRAIDTPQELAALGQYIVNIIDFRDTDCAITIWTNPDVKQSVPDATSYSALYFSSDSTAPATAVPLVTYGMEFQPVAINEAMAFSFKRRKASTSGPPTMANTPRFYLELVNMLTDSKTNLADGSNPSDLDLDGWEIAVLPDNQISNRPDVVTGQIPSSAAVNVGKNRVRVSSSGKLTTKVIAADENGPSDTNPARDSFYVLGHNITGIGGVTTDETDASGNPLRIDGYLEGKVDDLLPVLTGTADSQYLWVYLMRPADPLNPAGSPKVVVDSMRIPYSESGGKYTGPDPDDTTKDLISVGTQALYSVERLQPYRGGQLVPDAPGTAPPVPKNAYGYTEQINNCDVDSNFMGMFGTSGTASTKNSGNPKQQITAHLFHTLGKQNGSTGRRDRPWSPLVFHDRDFGGTAELLLVPGCGPGLFTKQFVERTPFLAVNNPNDTNFPYTTPPATRPTGAGREGVNFADEPHTYPYLPDAFYYTALNDATVQVGGQNDAGWYRLMEFLEVPSSAFGAIGPVADGQNLDWLRQDNRPGLLNINLIIDSDVFQGLIDDPRLNLTQLRPNQTNTMSLVPRGQLNPRIVTQVDSNGYPTAYVVYPTPRLSSGVGDPGWNISAFFADFLKLRHGGSGFLFAFGSGQPGSGYAVNPLDASDPAPGGPVAAERPFRSLTYPDINYTVMRPAALPPPLPPAPTPPATGPIPNQSVPYAPYATDFDQASGPPPGYVAPIRDSGRRNPNTSQPPDNTLGNQKVAPVQPPPIPPRRLFQIPDGFHGAEASDSASVLGDKLINTPTADGNLAYPAGNIFADVVPYPEPPATPTVSVPVPYGASDAGGDNRRHPMFRTEVLQKVMNLTTIRTHQYAVWVTVGFFEVSQPGNPMMAVNNPEGAVDKLGVEIGAAEGKNVRYRGFYVIDRTRATGFNPTEPGDFRELILHRRRIE